MIQDLGSWQPEPRVFAFSALKLLLDRRRARGESLDPKEAALLTVWATDPESTAFSDQEFAKFESELQDPLTCGPAAWREAASPRSRWWPGASGSSWSSPWTSAWEKGLGAIKEMETRLEARRRPLKATMDTLRQTLEGAGHRLKKAVRERVDRHMDTHGGRWAGLGDFIRKLRARVGRPLPPAPHAAFRPALYQLFQEFAKPLAHYVTYEVNITLVEFIRGQEEWLRQELGHLWKPCFWPSRKP